MKIVIAEYDNGETYEDHSHDVIAVSWSFVEAMAAVLRTVHKDLPMFTETECKSDGFDSTQLYHPYVLLYEMEVS